MRTAYKCRAYPAPAQASVLNRTFGCVRVVWNRTLATGAVVGVDLGIKDFAVTSGGVKIANPRKLARRAQALARYQRRLARCQRGSANRVKARAKVARAHRKVRASRTDFLHRTSTRPWSATMT